MFGQEALCDLSNSVRFDYVRGCRKFLKVPDSHKTDFLQPPTYTFTV